jgi:beta-fructofuranosidase
MLQLADSWVWDSWYFDDGEYFHAFFLRASRALLDSNKRHLRASIGHARSKDLTNWELLPDALVHGEAGEFDQTATWTGSTVFNPVDNLYYLYYTGASMLAGGLVQSVGYATSPDLISWHKAAGPVVSADDRYYLTQANGGVDTECRDPWLFYRDGKWHMTFTAALPNSPEKGRGIVGYAQSDDLKKWQVLPPLSPASGFGQIEVTQIAEVNDQWILVFCCGDFHFDDEKSKRFVTATFSCPADSPFGPYHFDRAQMISDQLLYAGRIVKDRDGVWNLLAFKHGPNDSEIGGWICDPIPLELVEGVLRPVSN